MKLIQTAKGVIEFLAGLNDPERADEMMKQVLAAVKAVQEEGDNLPELCLEEFQFVIDSATVFISGLRGFERTNHDPKDQGYRLAYLSALNACDLLDVWMMDHGFEIFDEDDESPEAVAASLDKPMLH